MLSVPTPRASAHTARVSVRLLTPFFSAIRARGLPLEPGLTFLGLTEADLDNPDLRVSHAVAADLLGRSMRWIGDRDYGLHAAQFALPAHLDVVEYVARAQPTLGKAIEMVVRYHALLHDGLRGSIEEVGDRSILRISFAPLTIPESAYEFALAVYLIAARRITGNATLSPLEVHFQHPRPKSTALHSQIFGCTVRFDMTDNALIFPRARMSMPLVSADSGLAEMLARHAEHALAALGRTTTLPDRVRQLVSQDIASSRLGADAVAKRLGLSARTLHRRLSDEGTSYRAVVDEVRHELAVRYLQDPKLSIREVGYLLGFTTGPAFHRAFKRWTQTTAAAYREAARKKN